MSVLYKRVFNVLSSSCIILLLSSSLAVVASSSKKITGIPSPDNYILHEEYSNEMAHQQTISVSSNVPLTIQRYYDDFYFNGQTPITNNDAKVLVTSDCDQTKYIPEVTWDSSIGGNSWSNNYDSITVNVQNAPSASDNMKYLNSSSYMAKWEYRRGWCTTSSSPNNPIVKETLSSSAAAKQRLRKEEGRTFSSLKGLIQRVMGTKKKTTTTTEAHHEEAESTKSSSRRELLELSSSEANLQPSCNVNVEILIDSCTHNVNIISAPSVRVIDAMLSNPKHRLSPNDECLEQHKADIFFDSEPGFILGSPLVPMVECMRATPGRPLVDASGKRLQALPLVLPTAEGLSKDNKQIEAVKARSASTFDNSTTIISKNHHLLGEEWTKNALGEHASVASFAAFSIALMSNGAPSDLVEASLLAAMDEVRHAKASFDIASRLTGKDVSYGPLPPSSHEFNHNLTTLAMSVAKEGCVDETLSALEVTAEVKLIDSVLENGAGVSSKYSGIDSDVLTWIRRELYTIASEESTHASLAWRTVRWVCSIDLDACNTVKHQVLNEAALQKAFERRFGSSFDYRSDAFDMVKASWEKIYSYSNLLHGDHDHDVCMDNVDDGGDSPLIMQMADKVFRGVSCMIRSS